VVGSDLPRRARDLPPEALVLSFVDCINRGDLDSLVGLMTPDHELRVLDEEPVAGPARNREAWASYFDAFPRYVIYPERIAHDGTSVAILGTTTGSHLGLPDDEERQLHVIWVAETDRGRVASWSIVRDTPEVRARMGLL